MNEQLKIPNHIAIVPDGNRRWARSKGLPTFEGHRKGFSAANADIKKARDLGIHTVTLWGFSTENWNRSKKEIDYLMRLFDRNVKGNLKEANKSKARIYHLGRKDRLPKFLINTLNKAEEETKNFSKHVLNIGLDYGGHNEILRAIEKIIEKKLKASEINKEVGKLYNKYPYYAFKNYLDTKDQPYPYPDLVIRTSGEQRLSGFMSWQMAYSEIYFAQVHMPDFGPEELVKAIEDFSSRNRTFGGN